MAKKENKPKSKNAEVKKAKQKAKSNSANTLLIIALITSIVSAWVSYKIYMKYVELSAVPDLPQIDLNKWWGPNVSGEVDTSIRPYRIMFTESAEDQLRKKFEVYRAVTTRKKSFTDTWSYGINSESVGQIFAYWQFKYNLRQREQFLNQYEHFKTNIQGLDIHFVHVKPKVDKNVKVFPLLLLHGWPSTFRDFYEAIPHLTTQQPGYDFVFELIIPSLPGYGYSQASTKPGLGMIPMTVILRNLMQRLGINQYYVQGGDIGHNIGGHMATLFPNEVLGFHTNFPLSFSALASLTDTAIRVGKSFIEKLKGQNDSFKEKVEFYLEEFGYMHLQGTKPDTIGMALYDSPVGLAAYLIDRFMIFTDPKNKYLEDGGISKYYTMEKLLDNVVIYWFTGSITTAIRLYKECFESELEQVLERIPTSVPTWALRATNELADQPDFILKWKYLALAGSTDMEGGHFIAMEKPKEFAADLFLAVSKFRPMKA